MPRVSVIVPAFNVERFVGDALSSALNQTYRDVEVVVVNDGSTDSTGDVISRYESRIISVEQPNGGLANARNAALSRATGEYVALLDSDDYWLPNRLSRMVDYLESKPTIGWATSDSFLVRENLETKETAYGLAPRWPFRQEEQAYWITQYNFIHIQTVVRRGLFERHGTFDERLRSAEDWDLWIRFLFAGEVVGFVPEPLGYYRLRRGSLSIDPRNILGAEVAVLQKAWGVAPNHRGLQGRLAYTRAKLALTQGHLARAKALFREAARDPDLNKAMSRRAWVSQLAPGLARKRYFRRLEDSQPTDQVT